MSANFEEDKYFMNDLKIVPFAEYLDLEEFYKEYKESAQIPDFNLFLEDFEAGEVISRDELHNKFKEAHNITSDISGCYDEMEILDWYFCANAHEINKKSCRPNIKNTSKYLVAWKLERSIKALIEVFYSDSEEVEKKIQSVIYHISKLTVPEQLRIIDCLQRYDYYRIYHYIFAKDYNIPLLKFQQARDLDNFHYKAEDEPILLGLDYFQEELGRYAATLTEASDQKQNFENNNKTTDHIPQKPEKLTVAQLHELIDCWIREFSAEGKHLSNFGWLYRHLLSKKLIDNIQISEKIYMDFLSKKDIHIHKISEASRYSTDSNTENKYRTLIFETCFLEIMS